MKKEDILAEIKRTAQENGGKPLGWIKFERDTGITQYELTKHWAKLSDAQKEAGLEPNRLNVAYDDDYLLDHLAKLTYELGKFPSQAETRHKSFNDTEFPNESTFKRLGNRNDIIDKLLAYCSSKREYIKVVSILEAIPKPGLTTSNSMLEKNLVSQLGEVYLFKSGRYYKIGMTKDIVRRGSELRIQLPEKMDLIHSIKTDDPSGIEAYWHRRFDEKRMNGEWFDLSAADIRAFKRWRKIY